MPITGLQAYEMLNIPHCLDNWLTDGGNANALSYKSILVLRSLKFISETNEDKFYENK
jgi:hypothetical protein